MCVCVYIYISNYIIHISLFTKTLISLDFIPFLEHGYRKPGSPFIVYASESIGSPPVKFA